MKRSAVLAVGVGALALSGLIAVPGTAHADQGVTSWEDGNTKFTKTVSDTNPRIGDTVTVSTSFQRKWVDEYIYNVKELVGGCMEFVPGTLTWAGKIVPSGVTSGTGETESWARVEAPSITAWKVVGLGAGFGNKVQLTADFLVTDACTAGEVVTTTMHYGSSLGGATYKAKGPELTIAPKTGGPGGSNPDGVGAGSLGTGSLGSLFGSS